jgi:hypothetical protein
MRDPRPLNPMDPDVRKLALIELSLQRDMPWAAIAAALRVRDRNEAKKLKAELEKRVRAKQYAAAPPAPEEGCDGAR